MAKRIPSHCFHKGSGRGVVRINGKDYYTGAWGTEEAEGEYRRLIAEMLGGSIPEKKPRQPTYSLSVAELISRYRDAVEGYYQNEAQKHRIRRSLLPANELFGGMPARDFGPIALRAVRQRMVDIGWCRGYVNTCMRCVKRMFRWAVSEELLPPATYQKLQSVEGLRKGHPGTREATKVKSVPRLALEMSLPHCNPVVRGLAWVQYLAGMRPAEAATMRACDVSMSGSGPDGTVYPGVWVYVPPTHKTAHHGHDRVIFLGPLAQDALMPFLWNRNKCDLPDGALPLLWNGAVGPLADWLEERNHPQDVHGMTFAQVVALFCRARGNEEYLFSPRDASEVWKRCHGRNPRAGKSREPGDFYTANSLTHAIKKACKRAGVEPFSANQMRHLRATEIRGKYGPDAARIVLGHHLPGVTNVYAEPDLERAAQIMREMG